jgi:hypothetical protein
MLVFFSDIQVRGDFHLSYEVESNVTCSKPIKIECRDLHKMNEKPDSVVHASNPST